MKKLFVFVAATLVMGSILAHGGEKEKGKKEKGKKEKGTKECCKKDGKECGMKTENIATKATFETEKSAVKNYSFSCMIKYQHFYFIYRFGIIVIADIY